MQSTLGDFSSHSQSVPRCLAAQEKCGGGDVTLVTVERECCDANRRDELELRNPRMR